MYNAANAHSVTLISNLANLISASSGSLVVSSTLVSITRCRKWSAAWLYYIICFLTRLKWSAATLVPSCSFTTSIHRENEQQRGTAVCSWVVAGHAICFLNWQL